MLLQKLHIHSPGGQASIGSIEIKDADVQHHASLLANDSTLHAYPGFLDCHAHVYGMGERRTKPRLEGANSVQEVRDILKQVPGSGWIVARGWDQHRWSDQQFPTKFDLDLLDDETGPNNPPRPICLTRIDGHALWCNSRALQLSGIDRETTAPQGGRIQHLADGGPSGILLDEAMKLVEQLIPPEADDVQEQILRAGLRYFAQMGHVAVHDMGVDAPTWAAFQRLYQHSDDGLPHAYVFLDMTKPSGRAYFLDACRSGGFRRTDAGRLHLAGVKFYLDGALGSRGANLFEPYSDDPGNTGLRLMDDGDVLAMMSLAAKHGLQIAVHAIGDAANHRALNLFQELRKSQRGGILRIEHAQIVQDSDVPRFAELGVHAIVQPSFYASDNPWAASRLGDRMRMAYRWKSLLDAGVNVVASSDAPVEDPDTIAGASLLSAAGREECIPQDSAVRAYCAAGLPLCTMNAADNYTILDGEIFAPGTRVVATVIDGRIAYVCDKAERESRPSLL